MGGLGIIQETMTSYEDWGMGQGTLYLVYACVEGNICCPDLPHVKAAQNSKNFQNCNLLHSSSSKSTVLEQKMQDGNPGVGVWSCGQWAEIFPRERICPLWTSLVVEFPHYI